MSSLTFRATDLQPADRSYWFDLDDGFLALPSVRGEDLPIPGRAGRLVLSRIADRLVVPLSGFMLGWGVEPGDPRPTVRETEAVLTSLFDLTAEPGELVAADGYAGLGAGQTATIVVRTLNLVSGPLAPVPYSRGGYFRRLTVELECVADPPEWVVEGS